VPATRVMGGGKTRSTWGSQLVNSHTCAGTRHFPSCSLTVQHLCFRCLLGVPSATRSAANRPTARHSPRFSSLLVGNDVGRLSFADDPSAAPRCPSTRMPHPFFDGSPTVWVISLKPVRPEFEFDHGVRFESVPNASPFFTNPGLGLGFHPEPAFKPLHAPFWLIYRGLAVQYFGRRGRQARISKQTKLPNVPNAGVVAS
jgi:hypothetical protein